MSQIEQLIVRAIDHDDASAASRVVDILRPRGWTYGRILAEVQRVRPAATEGDWDVLLSEADMADTGDPRGP